MKLGYESGTKWVLLMRKIKSKVSRKCPFKIICQLSNSTVLISSDVVANLMTILTELFQTEDDMDQLFILHVPYHPLSSICILISKYLLCDAGNLGPARKIEYKNIQTPFWDARLRS
jgi:hypothetical protein